jgi:hypothetical protein
LVLKQKIRMVAQRWERYPREIRQDSVFTDRNNAKNYGCSCVGVIVALVIIVLLASIPAILSGSLIFTGDPLMFVLSWASLIAELVILGLAIRWILNRRKETDFENM